MGKFGIQACSFGVLAELYYPDRDYNSALRLFRRELRETRGLWPALQAVGYRERQKVLSRAQVRVIVKYLGEP